MRAIMRAAGSAAAIFAMVGQALAAGCARPDEAMALKTAALQQKLMVAALYCNDVAPYNRFVTSHQRELQESDAALLSYFQHGHGGSTAYHAYKTGLANDFSLSGLHAMQNFCASANASFDAASASASASLAAFMSTQTVAGTEAYPSCETTTAAAGGEMVAGGSTRIAANRRN